MDIKIGDKVYADGKIGKVLTINKGWIKFEGCIKSYRKSQLKRQISPRSVKHLRSPRPVKHSRSPRSIRRSSRRSPRTIRRSSRSPRSLKQMSSKSINKLFKAIEKEDIGKVISLIDGYDPNITSMTLDTGITLLMSSKNLDITKVLLNAGANPNMKNFEGSTALSLNTKDIKMVKLLLDAGADPDIKNNWSISPLLSAIMHVDSLSTYLGDYDPSITPFIEIVKLLLQKSKHPMSYFYATENNKIKKIIKEIIKERKV